MYWRCLHEPHMEGLTLLGKFQHILFESNIQKGYLYVRGVPAIVQRFFNQLETIRKSTFQGNALCWEVSNEQLGLN